MTYRKIDCVADVRCVLGEGPVWVVEEQALYWVDIKGFGLFRMHGDAAERFETPCRIGSIAPRAGGGFIAATDRGIAMLESDASGFETAFHPESHLPDNRFNDGKVDRSGRFWAGTMDDREKEALGALYRIDADLGWARVDEGYRVTNGPAFSPDGRIVYHSDSARQTVFAFDMDDAGNLSNRRIFARFGEGDGYPDGMTIDAEGYLWIAFWNGWCLRRFTPDGICVETIGMPVQRPTSCTFGGPALDRLYITSARIGLNEKALAMQPYAGGLFMFEPGITGIADRPFAG